MEAALMIKTSLAMMTITGLGGIAMAISGMGRQVGWLVMLHALLAGSGLTLLICLHFTRGLPQYAGWSVLCLLVATLSGIKLHLGSCAKSAPHPRGIGLLHAAMAMAGYVLLLLAASTLR